VTRVVFNGTPMRDLHPDWVTLPQYFKQHGYVTATSGKTFHGKFQDVASWDEVMPDRVDPAFRGKKTEVSAEASQDGEGAGPPGVKYVVLEGDGQADKDYWIATDGIAMLEKYASPEHSQGRPFFIGIGFHRPHAIPTAPKRFYDMYDVAQMPLAPDFAPHPTLPANVPATALPEENDIYMQGETSPQTAREVLRAYRASASWTDWNLGRVLDALERVGLADSTIVVFVSDHGYHNGEKGRWGKTTVFEVALRVPLVIRIPGNANNGSVCERTVQELDLYPTLAELCSLPSPPDVQGHSLVPLLNGPAASWPWPACSMAKSGGGPIGYSIRTERWHYAEWDGGRIGAVLFDPAADPYETVNLAANPEHAATIIELKARLAQAFGDMPTRIAAPKKTAATDDVN
jgi:arylsulfatase A-like enzyme